MMELDRPLTSTLWRCGMGPIIAGKLLAKEVLSGLASSTEKLAEKPIMDEPCFVRSRRTCRKHRHQWFPAVDPNSFIPSFQQVLHGLAVLSTWKYSGRGSLSQSLKKQSVQSLLRAFARLAHVLYTKGIASSLQDAGAGLTSGWDKAFCAAEHLTLLVSDRQEQKDFEPKLSSQRLLSAAE